MKLYGKMCTSEIYVQHPKKDFSEFKKTRRFT